MGLVSYALTIFVFSVVIALTILNGMGVFPDNYIASGSFAAGKSVQAINQDMGTGDSSDVGWLQSIFTWLDTLWQGIVNTVYIMPLMNSFHVPKLLASGAQTMIYLVLSFDFYNVKRNTTIFG